MSNLGHWSVLDALPVFVYTADQERYPPARWDPVLAAPTTRHWVHLGNRRITLVADNESLTALWDESTGMHWLTNSTGTSRLVRRGPLLTDSAVKGPPPFITTAYGEGSGRPERVFGPTFFRVTVEAAGLRLERTVLCPEGEQPWVLVRVAVTNLGDERASHTLAEEWAARPGMVDLAFADQTATPVPAGAVTRTGRGVRVGPLGWGAQHLILEHLGDAEADAQWTDGDCPLLTLRVPLDVAPKDRAVVYFRFGLDDTAPGDPQSLYEASLAALRDRLPSAEAPFAPQAATEVPWHAALLTGGACRDTVLGGHTLDQGSAYAFRHGFNGAARDPLQHALPLVYTEPDLALSVLRNTCAWGSPDGDLPYALTGSKQPLVGLFRPSDANLWALWLAAEYAAATGDLAGFAEPVPYHPVYQAEPVPLAEHLRRQYTFFRDVIGRGANGHVRICNADWNDLAIAECGVDRELMIERGESVLNSAMAAWVLPVYAALADRLGDAKTAADARQVAGELRAAVAADWTGRWFRRAHGPGAAPVGEDDLWLEVQPWAILSGAATGEQARQLLDTIDAKLRAGSPLGARWRWSEKPRPDGRDLDAARGAIWYSLNMTLVWAAAKVAPDLARDEWRRMSLAAHAAAYPDVWEGTTSGPDAYAAPTAASPGRTWALPELGLAMQAYPVANLHSHAQPLLAYLRLLGVEPTAAGELAVGGGARFASRVFTVEPDGHGTLRARGEVRVRTAGGAVVAGRGTVQW